MRIKNLKNDRSSIRNIKFDLENQNHYDKSEIRRNFHNDNISGKRLIRRKRIDEITKKVITLNEKSIYFNRKIQDRLIKFNF